MSISRDSVVARLNEVGLRELAERLAQGVNTIQSRAGGLFITKNFQSLEELENGWGDTQTLVAASVQTNLEKLGLDPDLTWDIYLILMCPDVIPDALRLEIEYDKFCCKKYVVQEIAGTPFEESVTEEVPLLCEWATSESAEALHPGVNRTAILQRLTTGIDTALAHAMTSLPDFESATVESLVDRLIEEQAQ